MKNVTPLGRQDTSLAQPSTGRKEVWTYTAVVLVAGLRHGERLVSRHHASVLAVRNDGRVEVLGEPHLIAVTA